MSWIAAIWADLVEKRLWPVAALLVAGVIATPVLAHMGASTSGSSPSTGYSAHRRPVPPAAPVLPADVRALLASTSPGSGVPAAPAGPVHDPFAAASPAAGPPGGVAKTVVPRGATAAARPAGGSGAGQSSGSGSSRSGGSWPASTPPRGTRVAASHPRRARPSTHSTASPVPAARRPATLAVYTTSLRFGPASATRSRPHPVRLSVLPSKQDPQVVFLGVLRGGRRAAFLLASDVSASGDGSCRPRPDACQVLQMAAGDTEFLDVRDPKRGLVQYELDLVAIHARFARSHRRALRLHRRASPAGRALVAHSTSPALRGLSYSLSLGVLVPRTRALIGSVPGARQIPAAAPLASSPPVPPPGGSPGAPVAGASGARATAAPAQHR